MATLLSIGHGYSAAALAARLIPEGWRVVGTTRDVAKADRLHAAGVEPRLWPLEAPETALAEADALLVSAGPDDEGDPALRVLAPGLAKLGARLRWAGYLSTTGVYGDRNGAWVDEESPLEPATDRGRARVAAEAAWAEAAAGGGFPLHVFRLAGIYGPGRGPFEKVRRGTARRIVKPGQVFSRIHVDDIASALAASIARPEAKAGRMIAYNLCDDEPAPPQDVLAFAAELLGAPPPPEVAFNEAEMSPMARSFYAESKRVSNRRIKERLEVKLAYPTYREGLRALFAAEGGA